MRARNDYNIRVRNYYNLCRTKKIMRKKIKIILKNIWFNYSFDSYFGLKMLNWSSRFFSFNLVSIIEKLIQFDLLR